MLKKLIKYEFRYYRNYMLLTLLVMVISVILSRLFHELGDSAIDRYAGTRIGVFLMMTLPTLVFLTGAAAILAVFVPVVLAAIRFYRNLCRDEGYLSFTLPIKPSHHVLTKTLVPFVWIVVQICVLLLTVFLVSLPGSSFDFSWIAQTTPSEALLTLGILGVLLLALLTSILQVNFSIACGQLFQKHKLIGSIGCYIALNSVSQVIPSLSLFVPMMGNVSPNAYLGLSIGSAAAVYLILSAVFYFITCHIMTYKLNLE
jgi:hypothetical protein